MHRKVAEKKRSRKPNFEETEAAAIVLVAAVIGEITTAQAVEALRWDGPIWNTPNGILEAESELREAILLRAGLSLPKWCAFDPRLGAHEVAVCAALETVQDARGICRMSAEELADKLKVMPSDVHEAIEQPVKKLESIGIIIPLVGGGWLLLKLAATVQEEPEYNDQQTELFDWAMTLSEEQRKVVYSTLVKIGVQS